MIQASDLSVNALCFTSYSLISLLVVCTFYSSRRTWSSNNMVLTSNMVFTSDMVHILPDYPKKSPDDSAITLLAFYLQHRQGSSDNIVDKDGPTAIVRSDMSSLEKSIGGTILRIQSLSSTRPTKKRNGNDDERDEESKPTSVIIGASVGCVLLLVIIVAQVLAGKKSNR